MANTITLLNAMKSVFAGLGAKTTDSNYGVALLDKTSGEPKGFMGMSDLASVLGAYGTLNNATSFDTLTHNGCWQVANTHPDNPTAATSVLVSKFANSSYGCQIIKSSSQTLIRHYFGGWANEWQRLDNFNCNTPEALASLLGVLRIYSDPVVGGVWDLNTLTVNTIQYPDSSKRAVATNVPFALNESAIITLASIQGWSYTMQILINRTTICYRYSLTAGWQPWKKVTLTDV